MDNGLYTLVEFDSNDKWFVIAEEIINDIRYSYLIRVNENEDDFIDEYQVVKSSYDIDGEYMETVNGDELRKIMPILVPEASELIEHPEKLKKLLEVGYN